MHLIVNRWESYIKRRFIRGQRYFFFFEKTFHTSEPIMYVCSKGKWGEKRR